MDIKKIVNICLILAASLLYLVASQLFGVIFVSLGWDGHLLGSGSGGLSAGSIGYAELVALFVALVSFLLVYKNENAMKFFQGSALELSKVVYPTPKEALQSAWVVVAIVAVATGFLALFDWVWRGVVKLILT